MRVAIYAKHCGALLALAIDVEQVLAIAPTSSSGNF
jgi:hypothetical protein